METNHIEQLLAMQEISSTYFHQVDELTKKILSDVDLSGNNTEKLVDVCTQIHKYLIDNINYRPNGSKPIRPVHYLRTPELSIIDAKTGIDAPDIAILVAAILNNVGIKFSFEIDNNNVYVLVEKHIIIDMSLPGIKIVDGLPGISELFIDWLFEPLNVGGAKVKDILKISKIEKICGISNNTLRDILYSREKKERKSGEKYYRNTRSIDKNLPRLCQLLEKFGFNTEPDFIKKGLKDIQKSIDTLIQSLQYDEENLKIEENQVLNIAWFISDLLARLEINKNAPENYTVSGKINREGELIEDFHRQYRLAFSENKLADQVINNFNKNKLFK